MATVLEGLAAITTPADGGAARVAEGLSVFGGRSGLAAALAGTSNTKAPEYKAALRNVERWDKYAKNEEGQKRNPDRMRGDTYRKLGEAIKRGKVPPGGAEFRVRGTVKVSKDKKKRDFTTRLTADEIRGMLSQSRQAIPGPDETEDGAATREAMNVITGAYMNSTPDGSATPYSELFSYGDDVSVDITPL